MADPSGYFFDYEIHPQNGESGTYFYHSHVEFQAVSVAGPLIVKEASGKPPYQYDAEKVMFISEWYNQTQQEVYDELTSANLTYTGETEAILVNAQSYPAYNATYAEDPTSDASVSNNSLTCGPEVFVVEPGKIYRFRAVGGEAISLVTVRFEAHRNLSVIAADARYTKPAETDRIQIGPGQRFDWLLETMTVDEVRKTGKRMFWIELENRYRAANITSYAILKYRLPNECGSAPVPASPPTMAPLNITDRIQDWLEYTLEPLQPNEFPSANQVTRTVHLTSAQYYSGTRVFWTVNHRTWTEEIEHLNDTAFNMPTPNVGVPYLVNIYKQGEAAIPDLDLAIANGGYDPNLNVYAAEVGEIIDVVLENQADGVNGGFDVHPWHIHGSHVWDLGSGNGTYNATANEIRLQGHNPVLRDTLNLYKYSDDQGLEYPAYSNQGWRAFRLQVTDPGVWMVHCHILQHMIMGMQTVWVMGNASEITASNEPFVSGYLEYGGSAYGNATYDPLVNHHFND